MSTPIGSPRHLHTAERLPLRPSRAATGLLALLTLAAFAWRVQGLDNQSLWRDEVDAIYFALRTLPETLSMFVRSGQNGALYFLALRPWFHLVGASEFTLRFLSVITGTLSVPLLWLITRRLIPGNPRVAWVAALFFLLNPYQLWYGQEGKMYATITFLMLLASWWWLAGVTQTGKAQSWQPWLAYLLTVSVAIYTHLLMVLLIPVHLLWFFIAWPQSRHHWRGYGLALAGLTLPYLPMAWWHWALLTATNKQTGFSYTPLQEMARSLVINHAQGFLPPVSLLWLAPIFFLGLAGLALGVTEMGLAVALPSVEKELAAWRRFGLLLAWVITPVLTIWLISLRQPVFTERYVIWIGPALLILLALGTQVVAQSGGRITRLLTAILVLYVIGFWLYAGWQQKTLPTKYDLRGAIHFVTAHRTLPNAPENLLILQIPHMEWSYRYYSGYTHGNVQADVFVDSDARLGHWDKGLWTNGGAQIDQARAEVDTQMQKMTAGVREIWLVRSEVEMWDSRHLMDEWLDQHGSVTDQADFHGAQVRHYVLEPR